LELADQEWGEDGMYILGELGLELEMDLQVEAEVELELKWNQN
jgi:hypothetical protein